jgi:hypothetical protein
MLVTIRLKLSTTMQNVMFHQTCCQPPETRCVLALVVTFGSKALFNELICKDASLGEIIHSLLDFNVNLTVRSDNVTKVAVDDNFVGGDVVMEMHVFGVWHGGVEVESGKFDAQKPCPQGADGGIDEEFGRGEISCGCTLVARIINAIAANS